MAVGMEFNTAPPPPPSFGVKEYGLEWMAGGNKTHTEMEISGHLTAQENQFRAMECLLDFKEAGDHENLGEQGMGTDACGFLTLQISGARPSFASSPVACLTHHCH